MTDQPWYAGGLRFQCTGCGNCCRNHGDYDRVYLSEADVVAIARHLGVPRREFLAEHTELDDGWTVLRLGAPQCQFLDSQQRCTIYPVRPKQCATWPFWVENLERKRWEGEVAKICPGTGEGDLHSAEEVERIARETEEWYGE